MKTATYANCRTAEGARQGLNKGLKIAFSSGTVMGLTVVGLGLLDISVWFLILKAFYGNDAAITGAMLTFGMGASSMAWSRESAAVYSQRRQTWVQTLSERSRQESPRTTRETPQLLRITWAIMSVMLPEWARTFMNHMSVRLYPLARLPPRHSQAMQVYR